MNAIILLIIGIPVVEIYLMIKMGGVIGALNTILLIFFTAITGVYFAKMAGLSTIKSGLNQIVKNELPIYEIISGAALAFAALLLILPGFLTDFIGFLLIIPVTRKFLIFSISSKIKNKNINTNEDIIEGNIEENSNNNHEKDN
ncbi:FxsA family protein [Pelagibacteraceae bacterium]|jgi:UPF0716 protein FxsA|nr:FxsA family protein [Pelagibacteraceae bacterium]